MKIQWQERDKRQWNRIESVIKFEEDKVKAQIEAQRKAVEEEETKKRAEEEAKRLEQEKQQKEQQQQRLQKEKEAQEQQQREQAEKETAEREHSEASGRSALGQTTALEDWIQARNVLKVCISVCPKSHHTDNTIAIESRTAEDGQGRQEPEISVE